MNSVADKRVEHALVLSGGGGRGAYQVGVCQVLEEISWRPDMVLELHRRHKRGYADCA